MKLPTGEYIEARVVSRALSTYSQYSSHPMGIAVLLVETDGVLAAIKGWVWYVPAMAVAPEKSLVRFKIDAGSETVTELEILKLGPASSEES